jgi:large subunit ribosomal protein L21
MFAIVEASGRQYQLEAGRFIDIDSQEIDAGGEFIFDRVLMIVNGSDSTVGSPLVEGAKVVGKVLHNGRDRKIIVYKQKPKKGTRKKQGHRQLFTRVLIDSIVLKDKVLAKAEEREPKKDKAAATPAKEKAPAAKAKAPTVKAKATATKAK